MSKLSVIKENFKVAKLVSITEKDLDTILEEEREKGEKQLQWFRDRDGNATIVLSFNDGENPFASRELEIIDFGVADNTYHVKDKQLKSQKEDND